MDRRQELGGAVRGDLLVTPYLNTGINHLGDRISVERRSRHIKLIRYREITIITKWNE